MRLNKIILVICLFWGLLFSNVCAAQINPPEFDCIKTDSLFWQPVSNSCGPFVSVDVYLSNVPNGPFTLFASITDPAQDFFYHANPLNTDRYYYLVNNYNCPGQTAISSDTLSNLPLGPSKLVAISVAGNNVEINWTPSSSPQVSAYVIFRASPSGSIVVDTVYGNQSSFYLDTGADPNNIAQIYTIVAIDICGKSALVPDSHKTIFLNGASDECNSEISLNWSPYVGWENAVAQYELTLSIDGGPTSSLALLDSTNFDFVFQGAENGKTYCFSIIGTEKNTGVLSLSNAKCFTPNLIPSVSDLQLLNLSVRNDNTVELSWWWPTSIQLNSLEFLSGSSLGALDVSFSTVPGLITQNKVTRVDPNADASQGKIYFRVNTIDDCTRAFPSNFGSPIFLSGNNGDNLLNNLSWTPFELEGANILEYKLYKEDLTGTTELLLANPLDLSYTDQANPNNRNDVSITYFVEATFEILSPDGTTETLISRSNKTSIRQKSIIRVPNAFIPSGKNNLFRPLITFNEEITFVMEIYDRWGGLIFTTSDFLRGWDGRKGFTEMPMGSYPYYMRVQEANGKITEKRGAVLLVR